MTVFGPGLIPDMCVWYTGGLRYRSGLSRHAGSKYVRTYGDQNNRAQTGSVFHRNGNDGTFCSAKGAEFQKPVSAEGRLLRLTVSEGFSN